jgi:Flp pilus assembly protein TadG
LQRGATTVYFLLFTLVVFGLLAMATDFGKLYLIQGELQTAADAAALASAARLVGTANAALRASDQITASFDSTTGNDNRFNLRMNQIGVGGAGLVTTTEVDYFSTLLDALNNVNGGQGAGIDWSSGTYPKYVRVQISAQAPVTFFPIINRAATSSPPTVTVSAIAGISAPICSACGIEGLAVLDQSAGADTINFGFIPGQFYTLFLTPSQQAPNAPVNAPPLANTLGSVQYAILNHIPSGVPDLDLDALLFQLGAGGISTVPGLMPPGIITAAAPEVAYPDLRGFTAPGTTVGRDIICGLNVRFGVDPSLNICGTVVSGEFLQLSPSFTADSDIAPTPDSYVGGVGLQDFATEYDGSLRRVLTMAVVDAADSLNVLNFRQFLIEPSPGVAQGLNPVPATGAFRAQYIGAAVPLRCGGVGGVCSISAGVGRTVLH